MAEAPPPPEPSPAAAPTRAVPPPAHLEPRAVPWQRAFAWYEEAMQLFKRAPATWIALAIVTLACELLLEAVPEFGWMAGKIVVPLVACGMLYAAADADRGRTPSIACAFAAFRAPAAAIAAVVATGLMTFAAEAAAAWWIAGVSLLGPGATSDGMSLPAVGGVYAIGILATLPITFVPLHVLLEDVAPGPAFVASWRAFAVNTVPLLVYAAASLVLLGFGIATMGVGLVLVLPLWAASSYAAWKDVFAVRIA